MKDILYTLLGNTEGNSEGNLREPVKESDQIIKKAIEAYGNKNGGASKIAPFLRTNVECCVALEDFENASRIASALGKVERTIEMFSN